MTSWHGMMGENPSDSQTLSNMGAYQQDAFRPPSNLFKQKPKPVGYSMDNAQQILGPAFIKDQNISDIGHAPLMSESTIQLWNEYDASLDMPPS